MLSVHLPAATTRELVGIPKSKFYIAKFAFPKFSKCGKTYLNQTALQNTQYDCKTLVVSVPIFIPRNST
jgi:hypothetical protein